MDTAQHDQNGPKATGVEHVTEKNDVPTHRDHVAPILDNQLPKGYYYKPLFLGSYAAQAFGFMSSIGVFAMAAPNLAKINSDIGEADSTITWVAIVYTLLFAVGCALVGRISDIFGRRWFFIIGSLLGVIGNIVCSRAQNIPTLIGGMTLIGAASASQQGLYSSVIGELVPVKYRFIASTGFYILGSPFGIFATKVGIDITDTLGWRWIFYINIILNALSTICIEHFDYIGFVLFNGGFVLLILGLSWGGSLYAWKDVHVISTLVVGAVLMVAFIAFESFVELKDPYIPLRLFRNLAYNGAVTTMTTSAMAYYGFSIIWPTMAATLYPSSASAFGWKASAGAGMFSLGDLVGLAVASYIRHLRYFLVASMILGTAFAGAVAAGTQYNQSTTISMIALGCFWLGVGDGIAVTLTGVCVDDQNEIGTGVGVAASIRSLGGSIASTIFSTVLANRLKTTIPALVPPAVLGAGLPASSIASFVSAMQGLVPFSAVPGLTPTILSIGTTAYQTASSKAYQTCFLTSLAFCGLGVVGACFCADLNPEMAHVVVKKLHAKRDEKRLEQEDRELDY